MKLAALLDYTWAIPALPALAFILVSAIGQKTPEKGGYVAVALVALAGLLSLGVFGNVVFGDHAVTFTNPFVMATEWWSVGDYEMSIGVFVDPLTAFMLFVVGILVTLIVIYSIGYMHEEGEARRRYYAEFTLFVTGMLGLVVANNYLMLFIFWEIMGLCSYLLIGYWFTKPSAAAAAKKAFLTTRVGDVFLFTGIIILWVAFGIEGGIHTLDFDALFAAEVPEESLGLLGIANLFIFIGAVGKSAQFPLHVWLPDAMEGPTTVSALIHAATMVKAGVYLIARSYPLMVQTPWVLVVIAVVGAFTALFAATMALVNWDLKRVLAYSTLSQLGYMYLGLGVAGALFYATAGPEAAIGAIALTGLTVAMFHLFSHAFFKAGLFLSAGSVGHAVHSYDMRLMGGLRKHMPITTFAMLMGTISIAGIPPFSGFFSKDAILHSVYEAWHTTHSTIWLVLFAVGVLTAFLTAYYMFRLYFLTFTGKYRGEHEDHLHESPKSMTVPLAILGFFAIFGAILMFAFIGGGVGEFLHPSEGTIAAAGLTEAQFEELHPVAHGLVAAIVEPFTHATTYVSILAAVAGIALAAFLWRPAVVERNLKTDEQMTGVSKVLAERYYIDPAYNRAIEVVVLGLAKVENWFDQNVVDGIVNGIGNGNMRASSRIRRWNTGNVQDYALTLLGGFLLLVLLVIYVPNLERAVDFVRGGAMIFFRGGA